MSFPKSIATYLDRYIGDTFTGICQAEVTNDSSVGNYKSSANVTFYLLILLLPLGGMTMGSYAAVSGQRSWWGQSEQMIYSSLKLPLLVMATTIISLPSFFVLNTLAGLRKDFQFALWAIWSSLSSFAIIHCSLLPILVVFYLSLGSSSNSYRWAILFNGFLMGIASLGSQLVLFRSYRRLIIRNARHLRILVSWSLIFAFVGVQMGWTLRPFIGSPNRAPTFFREQAIGNAYLEVWEMIQIGIFGIK